MFGVHQPTQIEQAHNCAWRNYKYASDALHNSRLLGSRQEVIERREAEVTRLRAVYDESYKAWHSERFPGSPVPNPQKG